MWWWIAVQSAAGNFAQIMCSSVQLPKFERENSDISNQYILRILLLYSRLLNPR